MPSLIMPLSLLDLRLNNFRMNPKETRLLFVETFSSIEPISKLARVHLPIQFGIATKKVIEVRQAVNHT